MPEITQLELNLQPYLETAEAFPEAAEIKPLLDLLEQSIAQKAVQLQLREAGSAIEKLSAVLAAKCNLTLDRWDAKWNPREPIVADLTARVDLFVQGQQFCLADLFKDKEAHYYPETRQPVERSETVVQAQPNKLADAIEAEEVALQETLNLAHTESIGEWIQHIDRTLIRKMKLETLQQEVSLSIVQVWIALLFGEFRLERRGDFYEGEIWVDQISKVGEH